MLDEHFAKRLESIPPVAESVQQLFECACGISEARVFTAVVDVERSVHEGKNYLQCQMLNHWVVQQFAEYFSQVNIPIDQLPEPSMANFFRRLQMLAYSQFWECRAVQRLLAQLVGIAEGRAYEPRLLLNDRPRTSNLYQSIISRTEKMELMIAKFLHGVYSNQVRNAFAHSEFCVLGEYISLFNYDSKKESYVPSLRLETWDTLFKLTSEFIVAFFEARRSFERDLKSRMPYLVELPEFAGPFNLSQDDRGYWSARPI